MHFKAYPKFILHYLLASMLCNCSNDTLESNLSHSNLKLGSLRIDSLSFRHYNVAPNIASNERLYLGEKNDIDALFSFVKINSSPYWDYYYDSTITIDSVHFYVYCPDSVVSQIELPNLYFSPDSHFQENTSNFMDYDEFSLINWSKIGQPAVKNVLDTAGIYSHVQLKWSIDSLLHVLVDTLDTNLTRTFALEMDNNQENFIEIYSEEASTGDLDPKVTMYIRQSISVNDSVVMDTSSRIIYSAGDLSILYPTIDSEQTGLLNLSNGRGSRALIDVPFSENSLPQGSIIRSANLILPYDSSVINLPENLLFDPIDVDTIAVDSEQFYYQDPFTGMGIPYALSIDPLLGEYTIPLKNILQNIILGNESNSGFKLIANERNNPFFQIPLKVGDDELNLRLEIIYVSEE